MRFSNAVALFVLSSITISTWNATGSSVAAFIPPQSRPNLALHKVKSISFQTAPTSKSSYFSNGRPKTFVSYQDPSSLSMEELRDIANRSGFKAEGMSRTGLEKIANSFAPQPATNDPSQMTMDELTRIAKRGGYDLTGMERDALEKIVHEVLGTKPSAKKPPVLVSDSSAIGTTTSTTTTVSASNVESVVESEAIKTETESNPSSKVGLGSSYMNSLSGKSLSSQQQQQETQRSHRNFSVVSSYLDKIGAAAASAVTTYMATNTTPSAVPSSGAVTPMITSVTSVVPEALATDSSTTATTTATTTTIIMPVPETAVSNVKPSTIEERMAMEEKRALEESAKMMTSAVASPLPTKTSSVSTRSSVSSSSSSAPPPPGPFDFQPLPGSCLGPNGMGSSERSYYSPSSAPAPPVSIRSYPTATTVSDPVTVTPSSKATTSSSSSVASSSQPNTFKSSTSFEGTVEFLSAEDLEYLKPLPGSCLGTTAGKGPRMGTSSRFEAPSTAPAPAYEHLSNPKISSSSAPMSENNTKPRTIEERMAMEEKKAEENRKAVSSSSPQRPSTLEERMAMEEWSESSPKTTVSAQTPPPVPVPPPITTVLRRPKYVLGQIVTYKTGEEVQITAIHEDPKEIIYEILLKDGREKQTSEEYIFGEPQGLTLDVEVPKSKPIDKPIRSSILHMTSTEVGVVDVKSEKEAFMDKAVKKVTSLPVTEDSKQSIEQMAQYIQDLGKQVNDLKGKIKVDEIERQKSGNENQDLKKKYALLLEQNSELKNQNKALKIQNDEFIIRNDKLLEQVEDLKAINYEFRKRNDEIIRQNENLMNDLIR